jgi:hypothetical protein
VSEDDIERLASRMAMLVSDDGEADNAGRAVGVLARRLGLSGGQIKAMFLAGAGRQTKAPPPQPPDPDAEANAGLRRDLRAMETAARNVQRERDQLERENASLRDLLEKSRERLRTFCILGAAALTVAILMIGVLAVAPWRQEAGEATQRPAFSYVPVAVVRHAGTVIYSAPDRESPKVMVVPESTRLIVRQLVWKTLMQWVEVELIGGKGYVAATDVELP